MNAKLAILIQKRGLNRSWILNQFDYRLEFVWQISNKEVTEYMPDMLILCVK